MPIFHAKTAKERQGRQDSVPLKKLRLARSAV
jgi:hypothetical protein